MRDLTLGICPPEEDAVQVISGENYMPEMRKQAKRFLEALRKRWPETPEGTRFAIKTSPHDFGSYLDVVLEYPDDASGDILQAVMAMEEAVCKFSTWEELEADA